MTCIVGIAQDGKVYIGADSGASAGYDKHITALHKVFRVEKFILGYTTSFRMGQILQHHLTVRPQYGDESDERYMVVAFIEAVRACLKEKGFATVNLNEERGGTFLVGYRGNLYEVNPDFQINHWMDGLGACGSGEEHALAVMKALHDWQPEDRILRALEIASELSVYVAAPFHIEVLG